jgi:hypothetical protein
MVKAITLEKSCYVYLKERGEICNRLGRGTKVHPIKRNGDWVKVTWRNGKKKGWILKLLQSDEI